MNDYAKNYMIKLRCTKNILREIFPKLKKKTYLNKTTRAKKLVFLIDEEILSEARINPFKDHIGKICIPLFNENNEIINIILIKENKKLIPEISLNDLTYPYAKDKKYEYITSDLKAYFEANVDNIIYVSRETSLKKLQESLGLTRVFSEYILNKEYHFKISSDMDKMLVNKDKFHKGNKTIMEEEDGYYHANKRISDKFEYIADYTNEDNSKYGKIFKFIDKTGTKKYLTIATEDSSKVFQKLLVAGLKGLLTSKYEKIMNDFINEMEIDKVLLIPQKNGWYENEYFYPQKTSEKFFSFINSPTIDANNYISNEEIEEFLNNRTEFFQKLFFLSLAAPLLKKFDIQNFGVHLYGNSSIGKTTILRFCSWVWGKCPSTWRITDNALESLASAHNDGLLCLDEISQVDSKKLTEIVYMLGNGEGKKRYNSAEFEKFRLLFLSSGELNIEYLISMNGDFNKGINARVIDIAVGDTNLIFKDIQDFKETDKLMNDFSFNIFEWLRFIENQDFQQEIGLFQEINLKANLLKSNIDKRRQKLFSLIDYTRKLFKRYKEGNNG